MSALITAKETQAIAAQFPKKPNKYVPAVLEAVSQEMKKAARAGEREFERSKYKEYQNFYMIQRDTIKKKMIEIGFSVEFVGGDLNNIRIGWAE